MEFRGGSLTPPSDVYSESDFKSGGEVRRVRKSKEEMRRFGQGEPTEMQLWMKILQRVRPVRRGTPSPTAVEAVLLCARETDLEATIFPNSWPEGVELPGRVFSIPPSRHRIQLRTGISKTQALTHSINALATSGLRVGTDFIGHPDGLAFAKISAGLNAYPNQGSLVALYLAPFVRRYLVPDATPAWYFRHVARMRRVRARRPVLLPAGAPSILEGGLPPGYEWDRYEFWCLTAYLTDDEWIEKNPSNARLSRARVQDLVDDAAVRMTRLLKASPALATRFEELCGPLRHLLSQVVANSIGNITSRRDCAQHLVRLGSRSGAKLPKTDPQYIPYYYAWIYMLNLEHVKKVWQDTRGTRDPYLRRRQLEKIFYMLPLMSRTDAGKDAVDRFWCRCGNLLASPASDMAQHLTLFTLGLRLTPQRVREVLAKMNRRPSTGHQAPKVPPFPAFPIEFV